VRVLARSRSRMILLSFDYFTFEPVMNTRSITFDVAAGYAATVGRYLGRDTDNRDHFIEFTFWGLNEWWEDTAVNGTEVEYTDDAGAPFFAGSLYSQFDWSEVGGFSRADTHYISYHSDIHNYEFNFLMRPRGRGDRLVLYPNGKWRRECLPGGYLSFLFGLRFTSIDEAFGFNARGFVDQNGERNEVSGDYLVLTHNDLYGLQIGADYIYRHCRWSWGFRVKAGPFINFCDQASHVRTDATADPLVTTDLDFRRVARKDAAALVAEMGFVGTYKIRPNMVFRAAYDFMWVTGLALAPEQLTFQTNPPPALNHGGMIFYHGLTLGLELQW
jgi:hypothetical protein